jgi:hypothetical protein
MFPKAITLEFCVLMVGLNSGPHHDGIGEDRVFIGVEARGDMTRLGDLLPINHRKCKG